MHVTLYAWALGIGLLQGFLHCSGMCGPFVMAFSLSAGKKGDTASIRTFAAQLLRSHLPHNLGRILTFTAVGALFGFVGSVVNAKAHLQGVEALAGFLGGGLMILWAIDEFYTRHGGGLLERGSLLRVPLIAGWLRAASCQDRPGAAFVAGVLLGLHPCGLLFALLFSAAATGSPVAGALTLLAFGIGTTPALLMVAVVGWYGRRRWRGVAFSYLAATLIGCSGVLFVLRAMVVNGWIEKVNPWLF